MVVLSEQARQKLIDNALAEYKPGDESLRLPWQDSSRIFQVVKLPVDAVLLNPRSHRIRAQLESHENRHLVQESPYEEAAQEIIAFLLRADEGYEDLKTNLAQEGQREAGVITRKGLLVNANRRVVALRDIRREKYVRVAVLPANAIQSEIDQLELRLQVSKDYRIDYTFTNQLLFVEELLVEHNRTPDEAALELRWAASSDPKELKKGRARVEQATRLLGMIREVQHRSEGAIPITFFDDRSVALEEIDKIYESLRTSNPEQARHIRDARILGMLVNVQYRSLRQVDENFLADYLLPNIEDSEILSAHVNIFQESLPESSDEEIPGIGILGEAEGPSVAGGEGPSPSVLLEVLAKSAKQPNMTLATGAAMLGFDRDQVVSALRAAIEAAADEKKRDEKTADKLSAPLDYLAEADRLLKRGLEAYKRVHDAPGFRLGKFEYLVKRIRRSVDELKDALGD